MSIAELNEAHHAMQAPRSRAPSSLEEASTIPGAIARRKGDVPRAMVAAVKIHTATYFHQPSYLGRVWASLDRAGTPIAWRHRVASTVSVSRTDGDHAFSNEVDAVEGAADIPYAIPNILIEHVGAESSGLEQRARNGAGLADNAFTVECFIDELASLAGESPAHYRRRMLADSPRALAVLEAAVSRSGWDAPLNGSAGRGLAMQATRGSFLAVVAEIESRGRKTRVGRVTCAVECGSIADSRAVRRDVEAGILTGLASALGDGDGTGVVQRERPLIEIHFTDGPGASQGIAGPAAAAVTPAVANAIFNAAGPRIRTLPIVAIPKEVS